MGRYDEGDSRNWTTQQIYALWAKVNALTSGAKFTAGSGIVIGQDGSISTLATIGDTIGVNIDGGGSVLTTGQKGYIRIPYNATITGWSIVSREAGATSLIIDVWKKAGLKPAVGDSITGGAKPTLTATDIVISSNLAGWNTQLLAGDILGWNVDSVALVTWAIFQLTITKTA